MDLNATIIDPNVVIIEKNHVANILMDGRSGINVTKNHICKFFKIFQSKATPFILHMKNDVHVKSLRIF